MKEDLSQLAVKTNDRDSFSSLAQQMGLKNYALFSRMFSFYVQNNKEEIKKCSEV